MVELHGGHDRPRIYDRESLERWLDTLPPDQQKQKAIIVAARAALRVVPMIEQVAPQSQAQQFGRLAAAVFWATALARNVGICPTRADAYRAAATVLGVTANTPTAVRSIKAARAATHAATAANADAAPAAAASAAASAAAAAIADADAIWRSISADVTALEAGRTPVDLASDPLWPQGAPAWAQERWRLLRELLAEAHWRPWLDWYQRRLDGVELSEEVELLFATLPVAPQVKDPAEQNALLAQEIARLMAPPDTRSTSRQDEQQPRYDFFLSYSNKNDAFALFVDDVLRKAGFRVFAQWRDIPVGSNFVHEMNEGLSRSERLVALLSPDYVESKHAISELASAYNDDADGRSRKIVPLIIAPVEPPPLYRQVVWLQIFALSRDDAVKAILAAVGFEGHVKPEAPWPSAQTLDAITRESDEWYHVAPDAHGVMRRRPAASARDLRKTEGFDANELYAQMRREIEKIREHVCEFRGGGNFSFSERLKKRLQVLASATPEDFRSCEPLALDDALKDLLRVLSLEERDGALPPGDEIGPFTVDLHGHYQLLAVLFPSLRQYRKQGARRRFKPPPPEVLAAFPVIPDVAEKADDIIDKDFARDLAATGEAIRSASEAPLGSADEAREAAADAHLRAAAQVTPLWNWLSNPREKFEKLGAVVKDLPEVIEKYDKTYERLAKAKPYIQWLLSWWF
ncbi:toll/interleukin-1 receptor domain-containing protein [Methylosinus sp. H3A]|uniref:toll/interleukin-1 receptor domain-containing protein n=1 Tax=Methylosinus sp. H3A TaxID=2785786 RepID=UPI0018C27B7F|nr:toll/interleukin-1 receptor domain-containing protein [Methylosinus sp. H3A]MBG0811472.1 toll/interleukin-1 receptor domain-containing protein [Methylosinus sp. H3A]